jgi:hypothetical protein
MCVCVCVCVCVCARALVCTNSVSCLILILHQPLNEAVLSHKCPLNMVLFYVQVTMHRDNLHINYQQDASSIQNFYFVTKLYMFRGSFVPIIRSYQLYMWQLVCFMQVMWPLPRKVRLEAVPPRQPPHNLHETYQLPSVQLITPADGHKRCPKHVEFRDKIKILDT